VIDLTPAGVGGDQHPAGSGGEAERVQRAHPIGRQAQRVSHAGRRGQADTQTGVRSGAEPGDDRGQVGRAYARFFEGFPDLRREQLTVCAWVDRAALGDASHATVGDLRDRRR
jgi:hypothetical protein